MSIFVTGATGFIGSALVRELLQAGHRVLDLAFEKAEPGAIYHAVEEEGVSMKAIAEALGRGLKAPVVSIKAEEAEAHFGRLGRFAGRDMPASSELTRQKLNWTPTGPGLIVDLDGMDSIQA